MFVQLRENVGISFDVGWLETANLERKFILTLINTRIYSIII